MIDFSKRIKKTEETKEIDPIILYDELDRTSVTGPLRPAQMEILRKWFDEKRNDKNLIIKVHTGAGKTLIGLLILYSRMNECKKPCVYVCPNIYLADQAYYEAQKFGIPVCTVGANNEFPDEFLDGKRILICHVQKLFNGKTIFGRGHNSIEVGSVVLDDAHSCLDSIRDAYTITISRSDNEVLFMKILTLFENALKQQGEGTFIDIKENTSYENLCMIPYWEWINKKTEITELLAKEVENPKVAFAWPLVKNIIDKCNAYVNGKTIQIVPMTMRLDEFQSFSSANNRIIMSATTQDDIFFAKTLNFDLCSIRNPIVVNNQKYSGEKMLLLPNLMGIKREEVIDLLKKISVQGKFGVVVLAPNKKIQNEYSGQKSIICDSKNIFTEISNLQQGLFGNLIVLANRYDGIDLPDTACRVLVLDSMPFSGSMEDEYEERARKQCILVKKKIAQKIEQGLGRSVRGEKDYSCILIIGSEITKFIKSERTQKLFSPQTRRQVEIGKEMVDFAKEDYGNNITVKNLVEIMNQCIKRDSGWKEFYKSQMEQIEEEEYLTVTEEIELEKILEELIDKNRYQDAAGKVQDFLDKHSDMPKSDRGWYMQKKAHYTYYFSKTQSDQYQKCAFELNSELLIPFSGAQYKKLEKMNINRITNIIQYICQFENYEELVLDINEILESASFGMPANKFEQAVYRLGKALGYEAQRPDLIIKKGPDVLWELGNNKYIFFECKNEVSEERTEISKYEAGQMEEHCGWFEEEYGDVYVERYLIIPTAILADNANFSHEVRVIRKKELQKLKDAVISFYKEFVNLELTSLTEDKVHELIVQHGLNDSMLKSKMSVLWERTQK